MKYNLLFLLIFFYSGTALAADSLGRLFLTPEQRVQLEVVRAQRDRRLPITVETEAAPATAPAPQGPEVVTYSGVVRRSDGKSTVWLNGKAVNESSKGGGDGEVSVLGVRRDGAVSVVIPQTDRRASLKVGQSLVVESGVIEESYSRRETLPRTQPITAPAATEPKAATTEKPQPGVTPKPAASPEAALADRAPSTLRRPRESDTKEADPESGAAPAVRASGK